MRYTTFLRKARTLVANDVIRVYLKDDNIRRATLYLNDNLSAARVRRLGASYSVEIPCSRIFYETRLAETTQLRAPDDNHSIIFQCGLQACYRIVKLEEDSAVSHFLLEHVPETMNAFSGKKQNDVANSNLILERIANFI